MSIEAMKQALEALDWNYDNAIDNLPAHEQWAAMLRQIRITLRQAIAEAEKQEQKTPLKVLGLTVFTENRLRNGRVYDVEALQAMTNRDILVIPDMGKKALKEVLEALNVYASDMSEKHVHESDKDRHEKGTSQENRHIAMRKTTRDEKIVNPGVYEVPEFECPRCGHCCQQKEWVGLTNEEIADVWKTEYFNISYELPRAIEAKLKEKNT
jgi:rubrerythrin